MRRLLGSRLIWIFTVCKRMSELTRSPNLPGFTLSVYHFRKDVRLPQLMQRAMAAEAESTREARAKVKK